jgi:hypothetical protein
MGRIIEQEIIQVIFHIQASHPTRIIRVCEVLKFKMLQLQNLSEKCMDS